MGCDIQTSTYEAFLEARREYERQMEEERRKAEEEAAAKAAMEHGLHKVAVFVKGPGSGRETAIRSLQAAGLEVSGIQDKTPIAHNGCRHKKRRRN